jgi:hypothetical protein
MKSPFRACGGTGRARDGQSPRMEVRDKMKEAGDEVVRTNVP